jgi:hypothetical protein
MGAPGPLHGASVVAWTLPRRCRCTRRRLSQFRPTRRVIKDLFSLLVNRVAISLLVALAVVPLEAEAAEGIPLVFEMARGSHVRHGRNAEVTVRVRNDTAQPVTIYLRRDLITFQVTGPDGATTTCAPMEPRRHPGRRGFTTLLPHRSLALTSRLVELCPRWTFSRRGEYAVGAYYDPQASGQSADLHAYTGRLAAERSVIVNVERDAHVVRNHAVRAASAASASPAPAPAPKSPAPHAPPPKARPVPSRR